MSVIVVAPTGANVSPCCCLLSYVTEAENRLGWVSFSNECVKHRWELHPDIPNCGAVVRLVDPNSEGYGYGYTESGKMLYLSDQGVWREVSAGDSPQVFEAVCALLDIFEENDNFPRRTIKYGVAASTRRPKALRWFARVVPATIR